MVLVQSGVTLPITADCSRMSTFQKADQAHWLMDSVCVSPFLTSGQDFLKCPQHNYMVLKPSALHPSLTCTHFTTCTECKVRPSPQSSSNQVNLDIFPIERLILPGGWFNTLTRSMAHLQGFFVFVMSGRSVYSKHISFT